jgi:hypothetical protein
VAPVDIARQDVKVFVHSEIRVGSWP